MNSKYDDFPDYTLPFLTGSWNPVEAVAIGNFTGPNWSDGKRQGSVATSFEQPSSKLDANSRLHDRDYALCGSLDCLTDADWLYYERSKGLSSFSRFVGVLPLIGNAPGRAVAKALGRGYKGEHYGENSTMPDPYTEEERKKFNDAKLQRLDKFFYGSKLSKTEEVGSGQLPPPEKTTVGSGQTVAPLDPTRDPPVMYVPSAAPKPVVYSPGEYSGRGGTDFYGAIRSTFGLRPKGRRKYKPSRVYVE